MTFAASLATRISNRSITRASRAAIADGALRQEPGVQPVGVGLFVAVVGEIDEQAQAFGGGEID